MGRKLGGSWAEQGGLDYGRRQEGLDCGDVLSSQVTCQRSELVHRVLFLFVVPNNYTITF